MLQLCDVELSIRLSILYIGKGRLLEQERGHLHSVQLRWQDERLRRHSMGSDSPEQRFRRSRDIPGQSVCCPSRLYLLLLPQVLRILLRQLAAARAHMTEDWKDGGPITLVVFDIFGSRYAAGTPVLLAVCARILALCAFVQSIRCLLSRELEVNRLPKNGDARGHLY